MTTKQIIQILKSGGVGVLSTDTLYGLVTPALNPLAVERVYKLKNRAPDKPCIILINELSDLAKFGVEPNKTDLDLLKKLWPGKISVILPITDSDASEKFAYLHRGAETLAFRLPALLKLRNLIKKTGPLIAPSANPEGEKPAQTLHQAKRYFTTQTDFYFSFKPNHRATRASTLVAIQGGKIIILRPGQAKLPTE